MGLFDLFVQDQDFTCIICGNTDGNGKKRTAYGDICSNCLEKIGEFGIVPRQVKLYSLEQINVLCDGTMSAIEKAAAFEVQNSTIPLEPDEKCYYVGPACGAKIKTVTTGYAGKSKGTSIRITKGVSYHSGGSQGQAIREQVLEPSTLGTFIMTGKRFVLLTDRYGFEIPAEKVLNIELRPDGLGLHVKNKMHIVLSDDASKLAVILNILSSATQEYDAQKKIEESQPKPKTKSNKSSKSEDVDAIVADIRKYKALADDGIITEEEFQAKKKQLLGL